MTTAPLPQGTVETYEGPFSARLIDAELAEIRLYWFTPVGVTTVDLLTNALTLFFSEGVNGEYNLASSIPMNWAFSWSILFLVVGIVKGLNATPQTTLSDVGLRMQNLVGWVPDGPETLGAIFV